MSKETGGPAFPTEIEWENDSDQNAFGPDGYLVAPGESVRIRQPGMTLRDYFAAKAMQALIVAPHTQAMKTNIQAICAYELADAMIAERNRES